MWLLQGQLNLADPVFDSTELEYEPAVWQLSNNSVYHWYPTRVLSPISCRQSHNIFFYSHFPDICCRTGIETGLWITCIDYWMISRLMCAFCMLHIQSIVQCFTLTDLSPSACLSGNQCSLWRAHYEASKAENPKAHNEAIMTVNDSKQRRKGRVTGSLKTLWQRYSVLCSELFVRPGTTGLERTQHRFIFCVSRFSFPKSMYGLHF